MKVCSKCKKEKELTEYHKRLNRPCGVRSMCKQCYKDYPVKLKRSVNYMRGYDLNKSYGISIEQYNKLFESQKGKCAICDKTVDEKNQQKKKNLCVDHCHNTGEVRGLLCDSCNRGIGLFNDNRLLLNRASEYLTRTL